MLCRVFAPSGSKKYPCKTKECVLIKCLNKSRIANDKNTKSKHIPSQLCIGKLAQKLCFSFQATGLQYLTQSQQKLRERSTSWFKRYGIWIMATDYHVLEHTLCKHGREKKKQKKNKKNTTDEHATGSHMLVWW